MMAWLWPPVHGTAFSRSGTRATLVFPSPCCAVHGCGHMPLLAAVSSDLGEQMCSIAYKGRSGEVCEEAV